MAQEHLAVREMLPYGVCMEWSPVIGGTAAVLTTSAFLPQVLRCIRTRDTEAISLWMYILIVAGSAMWFVYGLILGKAPLIVANGITLMLSSVVLGLKVMNERNPSS